MTGVAQAALTTSDYFFSDQPIAATGHFEWDEFLASFPPGPFTASGPHPTDVVGFGGVGLLDAFDYTAQPFDGPPFPLITATENIYAGGTIIDFDVELTGLSTANSFTTVVLQISSVGGIDPSSVLLDGVAPSTLVDRSTTGVFHDTDGANALFGTTFYWAEWQVPPDADYTVEFANALTHTSLAQARVEYFNTEIPFTATAPGTVPEPAATGLLLTGLIGASLTARRCD